MFSDAKILVIDGKEVKSIVDGDGGVLYEKSEE